MTRQTYPVHCGWCNTVVRNDGPVEGSTGICPACLAELRKEADVQFYHSSRCAQCGTILRSAKPFENQPLCFECIRKRDAQEEALWRDEYSDQRRAIIHESWHKPSSFIDGFLIGGAVAILLGILAEYIFHLHKL